MSNTRIKAVQIVTSVLQGKADFRHSLAVAREKQANEKDRHFLSALCHGVIRHYLSLQHVLNHLLNKPIKTKDKDIEVLLVVGLYQLFYMQVPDYAVVSTAVKATKQMGKSWASALANRLLRRAAQEKDQLLTHLSETEESRFSHPQWLIDQLKSAWPEQWSSILDANNEQASLTLRIQTNAISREDYCRELDKLNMTWFLPDSSDEAVCLDRFVPFHELPGFDDGLFYVQDLSGQRVVDLLDLQPNLRVLDACAAPGSKTTHILTRMPEIESLTALDNQPERLAMVTDNLQRLGMHDARVNLVLADAIKTQQWWSGQLFDRILLDAPCTATGVIRRHPEIRFMRSEDDLQERSMLQQQLLTQLWPLLKPGGILLYTTCSVLPIENDSVVKKLIQTIPDARIKTCQIPGSIKTNYGRQVLPSSQSDGFFYACLTKKSAND